MSSRSLRFEYSSVLGDENFFANLKRFSASSSSVALEDAPGIGLAGVAGSSLLRVLERPNL
jgi:hypothetical protein